MFRRLKKGLPKDPVFPHNLEGLGYFINDKDEIRSIENPKAYFKFFLTKNDRHNAMQREAMNASIRDIVATRLEELGLQQILLPLGAKVNQPHIPIFISPDLEKKSRVIILFYEHTQDLGVFAHRMLGGKGGVNAGSAVDFVKYIQGQNSSPSDPSPPGVILANLGQLRWWRRGKKSVTQTSWFALPQASAVDPPYKFDEIKNTVPGNRTTIEHVAYIFNVVVEKMVSPNAKLNIIGVSDGAVQTSLFLEEPDNFKKWGYRVNAFAALATFYHANEIKNEAFREWMLDYARAYVTSDDPAGVFQADENGHRHIPALGCPIFSLGEPFYNELLLPKGYRTILNWFTEVAADPDYINPKFERITFGGDDDDDENEIWAPESIEKVAQETEVLTDSNRIMEIDEDEENGEAKEVEASKPAISHADETKSDAEVVKKDENTKPGDSA